MGQARNRGTFEERKAAAIIRNEFEAEAKSREERVEVSATGRISKPTPQQNHTIRAAKGRAKLSPALLAMMAGILQGGRL